MADQEIISLINRRRRQLLVHSYIYYELNNNLISDSQWSEWAVELVELQKQYPHESEMADYHKDFIGFDASTGYNLPYRNPEIMNKGDYLMAIMKG